MRSKLDQLRLKTLGLSGGNFFSVFFVTNAGESGQSVALNRLSEIVVFYVGALVFRGGPYNGLASKFIWDDLILKSYTF